MSDQLIRSQRGRELFANHPTGKIAPKTLEGGTATQIADWYIEQHRETLELTRSRTEGEVSRLRGADDDLHLVFAREDDLCGSKVVVYDQMVMGLPIFGARLGVHIVPAELAVISAQSSMHDSVNVINPNELLPDDRSHPKLTKRKLKRILRVKLHNLRDGRIERQVVYRFEPAQRIEVAEGEVSGCFGGDQPYELELPDLPEGITDGDHYIVTEVLFRASLHKDEAPVYWRALVEPRSGAVLYIRALVACATGMVFVKDPQTLSGVAVTGASSDAELNPFRSSVTLQGLASGSPQRLAGEYVTLMDKFPPNAVPPTIPPSVGAFNYSVRSNADDFSAVNAYYHCDKMFQTMVDYGFAVDTYFNGTTFPVPVDHRGEHNRVNASAGGNATGNGLGCLRFGLLQRGQPIGIATSNRVAWHEFGHAILWDHVDSPYFGFAHSAGDSLAAILNDPGSMEGDRFDTFPWVQEATPFGRRHDRAVGEGWAWFGRKYNVGYNGEQILSTTLFRLYRSIGGDARELATQIRASQTVAYLIFKAVGLLIQETALPDIFVKNLQNADRTTAEFKGIAGGALHKVVRWAFEKQGLFQPGARPGRGNRVQTEGNPPDVDVFIDDGRNGEYQYTANFWSCPDMWVRNSADGGLAHQRPLVGQANYMYVRVKNRGLRPATNVRVDAYHSLPGTGLRFPDDWIPMVTPSLPASDFIASGSELIVGPFGFVPSQVRHECLLAVAHADGDLGNDSTIAGAIPMSRFVAFDNNISQRSVFPVLPSREDLERVFSEHRLWIRNPRKSATVCRVKVEIPQFLRRLGWTLRVVSAGGERFEIGPLGCREILLSIDPGEEFPDDAVRRAKAAGDHEARILTYIGDELSGGMSYPISFEAAPDLEEETNRLE